MSLTDDDDNSLKFTADYGLRAFTGGHRNDLAVYIFFLCYFIFCYPYKLDSNAWYTLAGDFPAIHLSSRC